MLHSLNATLSTAGSSLRNFTVEFCAGTSASLAPQGPMLDYSVQCEESPSLCVDS